MQLKDDKDKCRFNADDTGDIFQTTLGGISIKALHRSAVHDFVKARLPLSLRRPPIVRIARSRPNT
jgi:hypothetical protein